MYEDYTNQCVPSKQYRELLGTALCVFNSNNSFVIENILRLDSKNTYSWHDLIDSTSGNLKGPIKNTIQKEKGKKIADLFGEIVLTRNRIIHSFQITAPKGVSDYIHAQILATKYRDGHQEIITKEFLLNFISENQKLSNLLHDIRGY